MNLLEHILHHKIVAIIRGAAPESLPRIIDALAAGGVRSLEITLNSPQALRGIEHAAACAEGKLVVGAGTVLDAQSARSALLAGAQFIVSPSFDAGCVEMTKKYGALSIPGAMTPTEILAAYTAGGDIIKVFPASALGPTFFRELAGPLPHIPLMPTGGVDLDNIAGYAAAGAKAFGLGSALVNTREPIDEKSLQALTQRARDFLSAVAEKA